jgi:hypothetical protein
MLLSVRSYPFLRYGSTNTDLLDEAWIKIHLNETLHKSKKERVNTKPAVGKGQKAFPSW